jgi:predicted GIY-YIG superfamily endonuclease
MKQIKKNGNTLSEKQAKGENFYKTKAAPPYYNDKGKDKTTFNARNIGGVYLIFKKDRLVYCGYSRSNLYRTLYRHFQEWTSPQSRTIYYDLKDITVTVIYCKLPRQAAALEKAIIIKHKPRDNDHKYDMYTNSPNENQVYDLVTGLKVKPIITNQEDDPF